MFFLIAYNVCIHLIENINCFVVKSFQFLNLHVYEIVDIVYLHREICKEKKWGLHL